jgi:hypothetical protein
MGKKLSTEITVHPRVNKALKILAVIIMLFLIWFVIDIFVLIAPTLLR